MALIGEAESEAEFGKRSLRGEHAFAGGADTEAMNVLADAFADAAAKHARKMNGMDAGFAGKFVEGEPAAVLSFQLI